ncbi:hypothetical protein BGZ90_007122, partial [Linnemannia elongata]
MGNTLSSHISPPPQQPLESDKYLIKIMGPTRAGKTSVLEKIKDPNAIINPAIYTANITCDVRFIWSSVLPSSSTQDDRSIAEKGQALTFYDTSSSERQSTFNSSFLRHTHGIIFVIDSSPQEGQTREEYAAEASKSLWGVIDESANSVQDQPLLVFVNKKDRPDSMTAEEVIELLYLEDIFRTKWSK